jgi:hypothetical protein
VQYEYTCMALPSFWSPCNTHLIGEAETFTARVKIPHISQSVSSACHDRQRPRDPAVLSELSGPMCTAPKSGGSSLDKQKFETSTAEADRPGATRGGKSWGGKARHGCG